MSKKMSLDDYSKYFVSSGRKDIIFNAYIEDKMCIVKIKSILEKPQVQERIYFDRVFPFDIVGDTSAYITAVSFEQNKRSKALRMF